jgi:hypothetical protein
LEKERMLTLLPRDNPALPQIKGWIDPECVEDLPDITDFFACKVTAKTQC